MTLNDLEGLRSLSQKDLINLRVTFTKFKVPIVLVFKLCGNKKGVIKKLIISSQSRDTVMIQIFEW